MTCRFCDIAQRKVEDYVIWEDDKFIAFLDITPAKPSHCMLIPKLHVDYFFDLPESLYLELFKVAKRLSRPMNLPAASCGVSR